MKKTLVTFGFSIILLAGCDSYSAQQYQRSPQNTIQLQAIAAKGKRASIGVVQLAEGVDARPMCRLAGPLDLGGGDNLAETIKQALQVEFLEAGFYKDNGVKLNVNVTQLKPDSLKGEWTIGLQVYSRRNPGFSIQSTTGFSTSFTAVAACNNTVTAFNRALSDAINVMITDPRFKDVI